MGQNHSGCLQRLGLIALLVSTVISWIDGWTKMESQNGFGELNRKRKTQRHRQNSPSDTEVVGRGGETARGREKRPQMGKLPRRKGLGE